MREPGRSGSGAEPCASGSTCSRLSRATPPAHRPCLLHVLEPGFRALEVLPQQLARVDELVGRDRLPATGGSAISL